MCLGESTTISVGNNAYPYQLEDILNRRNIGTKFSVINKGVPSVTTSYILENLPENLNKYKPDMVITMMGVNDQPAYSSGENISENNHSFLEPFRIYKM